MKSSVFPQFATVRETNASLFDNKLNETLYKLREKEPTVRFSEADPLCAYVAYTERETLPETITDAYALNGFCFVCEQCPLFRPTTKTGGTKDKRCKVGDCLFDGNELGRTYGTAPACDHLHELIKAREVVLCLK